MGVENAVGICNDAMIDAVALQHFQAHGAQALLRVCLFEVPRSDNVADQCSSRSCLGPSDIHSPTSEATLLGQMSPAT